MNKKFSILLIGLGGIGVRHLQSILSSEIPLNIYCYDVSNSSIENCKESIKTIDVKKVHQLGFFTNLELIDKVLIDLAIIATTSKGRFELILQISNKFDVRNIVLEKFLFQSLSDYQKMNDLIASKEINVYVNCARRMYPIYKFIKPKINGMNFLKMAAIGHWFLASNSIHFLDLFCYLINENDLEFDYKLVDRIIKSKRSGYYEVEGNISFQSILRDFTLSMDSKKDLKPGVEVNIETESHLVKINERTCIYSIIDKESKEIKKETFKIPYQSELSKIFIEDILTNGKCDLTEYSDSSKMHLYLVNIFSEHFTKLLKSDDIICPIT